MTSHSLRESIIDAPTARELLALRRENEHYRLILEQLVSYHTQLADIARTALDRG